MYQDKIGEIYPSEKGWWIQYRPTACLHVTGEDALTFLQGQFTQELRSSATCPLAYGLWLNQKGKVLADGFVLREAVDNLWIISFSSGAAVIRERLEAYVIADDVVIEDVTADWMGCAMGGPEAAAWLAHEAGGVPKEGEFLRTEGGGFVFRGRRGDGVSYEWIAPSSAKTAGLGGAPMTLQELERMRIAAGFPQVPQDIGPGDLPNEGGLDVIGVSFTKGCYPGQEVVARMQHLGKPKQMLVGLRVQGDALPMGEAMVFSRNDDGTTGEHVGAVTSSSVAPMLSAASVAFAMLRSAQTTEGTEVFVECEGAMLPARVQSLRFFGGGGR